MNYVWILTFFMLSLIPLLGLLGYLLQRKLGKENYQNAVLPKLQGALNSLLGFEGNVLVQALNPNEWITDKKSIFIILIGIPLGVAMILGFLMLLMFLSGV